jgi:hypothetical protein
VRDILHAFDDSLSMQECGYIVRQAFPGLQSGEYILCGIIMGYHLEIPMPADT